MNGATDLDTILASINPQLSAEEFVFCTFPEARYSDHAIRNPVACVTEDEGLTAVGFPVSVFHTDFHDWPQRA